MMVSVNIDVPLRQALFCWVSLVCCGAEHPPAVHGGDGAAPPKPAVVGDGPMGRRSREVLRGDTLPKVDVAAMVALNGDRSSVRFWVWQ